MGEMTILRPIFGRGVAQRRLGAEVPELYQKFPHTETLKYSLLTLFRSNLCVSIR